MSIYKCLACNKLHTFGKSNSPHVKVVERHHRLSMEDVWRCPWCKREHRTTDGTMLGQLYKMWKQVDEEEKEREKWEEFFNGETILRVRRK